MKELRLILVYKQVHPVFGDISSTMYEYSLRDWELATAKFKELSAVNCSNVTIEIVEKELS